MSKKLQFVNYSDVHWFQLVNGDEYQSSENTRPRSFNNPLSDLWAEGKKHKPTSHGLVGSMSRGYEARQGTLEVYPLDKEGIAAAVKQRQEQIAVWESSEDKTIQNLAATAKLVWKNPPKYGGNMGFRRAVGIMGAIHVLNYDNEKPEYTYDIPVLVVEYENENERLLAHIGENTQKTEGASVYQPLDYVVAARRLVGACGIEADLTRAGVKRGTAQKAFAIAKLDAKFPELKLVERLLMEEPTMRKGQVRHSHKPDGFIPFGPLDKEELRDLAQGRKAKADRAGVDPAKSGKEVEEYVERAMRGVQRTTQIIPRKRLETAAETHDCLFVRAVCQAILEGKEGWFDKVSKRADELNKATEGKIPPVK